MQEQQSKKAPKTEEEKGSDSEPEEEEEAHYAKGNSVFDAPVTNLAAGLQLGFTPSTAGKGPCPSRPPSLVPQRSLCSHDVLCKLDVQAVF